MKLLEFENFDVEAVETLRILINATENDLNGLTVREKIQLAITTMYRKYRDVGTTIANTMILLDSPNLHGKNTWKLDFYVDEAHFDVHVTQKKGIVSFTITSIFNSIGQTYKSNNYQESKSKFLKKINKAKWLGF